MPVNELSFEQSASILNAISEQATGVKSIAPLTTADFVTMGTTVLKTGYDNTLNAISQVLTRTIIGVRPYTRLLKGLKADNARWGNHVRKINYIDQPYVDDVGKVLVDGTAPDQYKVRNAKVVQTNFYGFNTDEDYVTVYQDQLDTAFRNPAEFGSFITGLMQNLSNKHEQRLEHIARLTLANFIGAKITADSDNVIHLLTEYNTETGLSLTSTTVMQPDNYKPFMQWVYGRIASLTSMMRNRSAKFHMNVSAGDIMRHTPYDKQVVFTLAKYKFSMEAMVLADTYHDNYLKMASTEAIDFWQDIDSPDTIKVTPNYIDADGKVVKASEAVEQADVFGVIFDEEACAYNERLYTMTPTPINARGRYYNIWYNNQSQWLNDLTENGVVLLMD